MQSGHSLGQHAMSPSGRYCCPEGRANAAAVLIRDITRRSPKRDCATPARGECQRLIVSHVNGQHAHGLRPSNRRIALPASNFWARRSFFPRSLRRPHRHGRRSRSPRRPKSRGPDLLHLFERRPRIFALDGLAGTVRRRVGTAYVGTAASRKSRRPRQALLNSDFESPALLIEGQGTPCIGQRLVVISDEWRPTA